MMLKAPVELKNGSLARPEWSVRKAGQSLGRGHFVLAAAALPVLLALSTVRAEDTSPAPILQWFDGSYDSIEKRMADVFKIGYGTIYTPPPGRADSGNQSVGYDQYDRFDLGSPGNPTLYGTETGLKKAVVETHKAGLNYAVDLVLNHAGFSDLGTPGFYEAGGYPGMNITLPGAVDGDFNSSFEWGDINGRLAGLVDIDHGTNFQMIRSPVNPNDPDNIRPGTTPRFGRLANVADPNNARFYPDTNGPSISVFDPKTGEQNIKIYAFNNSNPTAGDAVKENVTGYLMRNTQWLAQSIGVDAFRLDAAKHMRGFALDYYDRSVYRQSTRRLLDGSQPQIFSWSEVFDGDKGYLQTFVRKDINPNDPGRIGGNRDTMDFPLFFAMGQNLSGNGLQNDWRNVVGASLDMNDDGKMNGSQGVKFVQSHDSFGPALGNTAHAYTLMLPGNTIVYYNAKEFGAGRDFPKDGRGDALGGAYGDTIPKLVKIRDVYAQGDYRERWLEKENYAFERSKQSVTLLSNRTDDGFDSRTLNVDFDWGEHLVELTGNAAKYNSWHPNDEKVPEVVTVFNDFFEGPSKINVRFLRGNNSDMGYLVYGLQAPQGSLSMTGISQTLVGGSTVLTGTNDEKAYQNATRRLSDLKVIKGDTLGVTLNTNAVNLLGSIRDRNADGDNALIKIDEGIDLNKNGHVDFVTPGNAAYGFEEFSGSGSTKSPGYFNANGNGSYSINLDATALSEGYHYLTVRAFRHRPSGGPAVYQDFKEVLYVDRFKPESSVDSYHQWDGAAPGEHDVWLRSNDQTADSMHVFLNLPAGLTEAQIMQKVQNGEGQAAKIDRDIFKMYFGGDYSLANGNNTLTLVTFEITGTSNVQRFTGIKPGSARGAGFSDTNFNGVIDSFDMSGTSHGVEHYLYARETDFNPAVDLDGDGKVDTKDVLALAKQAGITGGARTALQDVLVRRANINGAFGTDQWDIDALFNQRGATGDIWTADLNVDGTVDDSDVSTMVEDILLTRFGDLNLDHRVDLTDLQIMSANWQQADRGWAMADITGDRFVSEADRNLLGMNWNFGVPANEQISFAEALSIVGNVPEPSSAMAALTLGAVAVLRRRRRYRTICN